MTTLIPPIEDEPVSLIEALLAEQRDLTAVQRFSHWHESRSEKAHNGQYRGLMPVSVPKEGEQYAFEVDLDKCSGCKACVTACHSFNGLDETETWRSVGLLLSPPAPGRAGRRTPPVAQVQVTTACHHCVDPACLNGCPVLAYEKDPLTGIVRHLDDQCIGCQYCILKCPYDVPRYSKSKGIVRKCDMCKHRLACRPAPTKRFASRSSSAKVWPKRVPRTYSCPALPSPDTPSRAPSTR